jgi:penicillin-binding protein 1A
VIRFILSGFGAIFSAVTLGVMMMALTIGAVFWMYGRDLPSHASLAQYQPATISRIYSTEGNIIDEFAKQRRLFTASDKIPDLIKQAFISAEDKNFYLHKGYDGRGIISAAVDAVRSKGRNVRGASTITQQVMKNFLLSGDRRAERKVKEIILATRLENTLNKEQILELYLNEIFLGQNSYGVTAAAQTYFNKTLDDLAPHEAAFLASLPKAPSDFHPVRRKQRVTNRRNFVLKEMFENGYLTQVEYQSEKSKPLRSVQNGDFVGFKATLPPRDYFTDEIRRQLSRDFGEGEFFSGGFTVRATIDPKMQVVAARALRSQLELYDRARGVWHGTELTIDPSQLTEDGLWRAALAEIRISRDVFLSEKWRPAVVLQVSQHNARVGIEDVEDDNDGHWISAKDVTWAGKRRKDGSKGPKAKRAGDLLSVGDVVLVRKLLRDDGSFLRWSLRQIPKVQGAFVAMDVNNGRVIAMQGGFSYQHSVFNRATQAKRQPGSNFKPFVYASALDSGYSPATIVIDAPIEVDTPQGVWSPKNSSSKFYGPTPLRTGIEQSRNLMTVRLAREVGLDVIADYAEKFGVYDRMDRFLANALGAQETTLYRVVSAYAMFANGGERVQPTLIDRVQDRYGATVYRHDQRQCVDCGNMTLGENSGPQIVSDRERVMDAITAYQLTSMMQGTVTRGTAVGVIDLPVPVAGKTGTTNQARDVWFTGFTSNIVAGCYIGFDQPQSLAKGSYGGSMCGPVFQSFMTEAVQKFGGGDFKVPEGGTFINIDRFNGARLADDAEGENVVSEFFRDGEDPIFGVQFDGGFSMGGDFEVGAIDQGLGLLSDEEDQEDAINSVRVTLPVPTPGIAPETGTETTSEPQAPDRLEPKASFGSMSSGGLY